MHPIGEAKGRLQSHERGGRIRRIRALSPSLCSPSVSLWQDSSLLSVADNFYLVADLIRALWRTYAARTSRPGADPAVAGRPG